MFMKSELVDVWKETWCSVLGFILDFLRLKFQISNLVKPLWWSVFITFAQLGS